MAGVIIVLGVLAAAVLLARLLHLHSEKKERAQRQKAFPDPVLPALESAATRSCPDCGGHLTSFEPDGMLWCGQCTKEVPLEELTPTGLTGTEPTDIQLCSRCGNQVTQLESGGMFWCSWCGREVRTEELVPARRVAARSRRVGSEVQHLLLHCIDTNLRVCAGRLSVGDSDAMESVARAKELLGELPAASKFRQACLKLCDDITNLMNYSFGFDRETMAEVLRAHRKRLESLSLD